MGNLSPSGRPLLTAYKLWLILPRNVRFALQLILHLDREIKPFHDEYALQLTGCLLNDEIYSQVSTAAWPVTI